VFTISGRRRKIQFTSDSGSSNFTLHGIRGLQVQACDYFFDSERKCMVFDEVDNLSSGPVCEHLFVLGLSLKQIQDDSSEVSKLGRILVGPGYPSHVECYSCDAPDLISGDGLLHLFTFFLPRFFAR